MQNTPRTVVVDYDDFRRIKNEATVARVRLSDLDRQLSGLIENGGSKAEVTRQEDRIRVARRELTDKEAALKSLYGLGIGARRNWPSYQWKPALRWMIVSQMDERTLHAFHTFEIGKKRPLSDEDIKRHWLKKAVGETRMWPAGITFKERDLELQRLYRIHDFIARAIDKEVSPYDPNVDQDEDEFFMRRYHAGDLRARFATNKWQRGASTASKLKDL